MSMKWNGDALDKRIEREMGKRLDAAAKHLQDTVKKNISTSARKHGYSVAGGFPNADIGRLMGSIFRARDGMTAIVGVPKGKGVVYGKHLEQIGHVYTPDTKKYMAVPISEEAQKWSNGGKSVWEFPIKLVRIIRGGNRAPLLVEITSKRSRKFRGAWRIHFILLKHVWVAGRHFLKPTLDQESGRIQAILGAPL